MAAVSLIHHKGYFRQILDASGHQTEVPDSWDPHQLLTDTGVIANLPLNGRTIALRVWRYEVVGISGHRVPVYLLDSDLEQNQTYDRTLTDTLYGGDQKYRLEQEALLDWAAWPPSPRSVTRPWKCST